MNVEMKVCAFLQMMYVKNSNEGHLAGFCVKMRAGVSLYVGFYGTVDVTAWYVAGFYDDML